MASPLSPIKPHTDASLRDAHAELDEILKVPARQYLEETTVPLLLQALKALSRERPENPIDYLALYLLKRNPNKNITVEVPLK